MRGTGRLENIHFPHDPAMEPVATHPETPERDLYRTPSPAAHEALMDNTAELCSN